MGSTGRNGVGNHNIIQGASNEDGWPKDEEEEQNQEISGKKEKPTNGKPLPLITAEYFEDSRGIFFRVIR